MRDEGSNRAAELSAPGAESQAAFEKPLLAVDVDGVISLFGFEGAPPRGADYRMQLVDGAPHCISLAAGRRLSRLCERFEMAWASGWEHRANVYLPSLLGRAECPHIGFDAGPRAGEPTHWKLVALERHATGRPVAWVDDSLDHSCFQWAELREEPTLLVPTEPQLGLEESHVAALESWAESLAGRAVG